MNICSASSLRFSRRSLLAHSHLVLFYVRGHLAVSVLGALFPNLQLVSGCGMLVGGALRVNLG